VKLNMSLRIKVFIVAALFIVLGQVIYSRSNVATFQQSYVESLREKAGKAGAILKREVEYILDLKIPLTKLIKMENMLKEVLGTTPELEFIEITDITGNVLYFADHQAIGRYQPGTRQSLTEQVEGLKKISGLGLSSELTDASLPLSCCGEASALGFIKMRLSADLIVSKSREILLDMITAILTSLLITFEFLTFFAAYSISNPIMDVVSDMRQAILSSSLLPVRRFVFLRELSQVCSSFNQLWGNALQTVTRLTLVGEGLQGFRRSFEPALQRQAESLKDVLSESSDAAKGAASVSLNPLLHQFLSGIIALQQHLKTYFARLSSVEAFSTTREAMVLDESERMVPESAIPYAYIRPVIFLFLIADGFSVSFLPLYVNTLYEPLLGLSREVVIGLPISFYMLFFALSMPICGSWADAIGWWKLLIFGTVLNALGMLLTAIAADILQLIVFRCLTAIGFGMVFMSCQQFVMENTLSGSRTAGMASFLAAFFSGDLCGTVIGGMLADRIGYRAVFLVGGGIALSSLVCAVFLFRNLLPEPRKRPSSVPFPLKNLFRVIRDVEFFSVVFLQGIPAKIALIGFLYYFVPLYLKRLGTLQSNIGRVLMCYGVTLVFLNPAFSKLLKKTAYQRHFIALGGLLTGLAMISFQFSSGLGPILFLVVMLGIAHTFSVPSQAAYIAETKIVKELGTGAGMGLYRFWERIGNVSGPLFLGCLMAWAGYEQAVAILGLMTVACTLVYLLIMAVDQRRRKDVGVENIEIPQGDR
jgi:predicted MFS family arabinose efflux permease